MLAPNDRWLLAVSGGPDSMAMLHALVLLQRQLPKLQSLHIVHLNHKIRGLDSELDAQFVGRQAQLLNIPATIEQADIPAMQKPGESLETAARHVRYEFLLRVAHSQSCSKIVLAHNADDNVETVLHRFIRGTGIRGLAGIPYIRDMQYSSNDLHVKIIRPLLDSSRSNIEQFLEQAKIPFRIDDSNFENDCTRNQIRNLLLPLLRKQYNPAIDQSVTCLSHIAAQTSSSIASQVRGLLPELIIDQDDSAITLDASKLRQWSLSQQSQLLHQIMTELKIPLQKIGFRQIRAIMDLLASAGSGTINLPANAKLICTQERLTLQRQTVMQFTANFHIRLQVPGITNIDPGLLCLAADRKKAHPIESIDVVLQHRLPGRVQSSDNLCEQIDADKIKGRLYLRTRRDLDRIWPLGAPGEKTIGNFFTDSKVPSHLRQNIAILCDDIGPLWVLGLRIANRVKITQNTKQTLSLQVNLTT